MSKFMGWDHLWGAKRQMCLLFQNQDVKKKKATEKKQEGRKEKHDCVSFPWGGVWKWKLNTAAIRASENRYTPNQKWCGPVARKPYDMAHLKSNPKKNEKESRDRRAGEIFHNLSLSSSAEGRRSSFSSGWRPRSSAGAPSSACTR